MDLQKIQATIETEIEKASAAERKRIVALIKDFSKDLIEAIVNGEDDAPAKPTKKAKKAPAKKAPAKKKAEPKVEEPEDKGEAIDGADYVEDFEDVDDDEIKESDYANKNIGELKKICEDRNITMPAGLKRKDLQKLLILVDEDQGE